MGQRACCCLQDRGSNDGDPVAATRATLSQQMERSKETLKHTLSLESQKSEMVHKVIELMVSYTMLKVEEKKLCEVFSYLLIGPYLVGEKPLLSFPPKFGHAIGEQTRADALVRCPDLSKEWLLMNFRDVWSHTTRELAKEPMEGTDNEEFADCEPDRAGWPQPGEEAPADDGKADVKPLLDFLHSVYDLVDLMPRKVQDEIAFSDADKRSLEMRIGSTAFAIKAWPMQKAAGINRVAVVGPESVGKSTFINFITSNGRSGDSFMPTDPGMGTQAVCIISEGNVEKFKKGMDGTRQVGNVQQQLSKFNAEKKRGCGGGLRDFDVLHAEKPFCPTGDVQIMDVPGIREKTALQSSVAISIATSLVVCVGDVRALKAQLDETSRPPGSMSLLHKLVAEQERAPSILCLAINMVSRQDFESKEEEYMKLMKAKFPKSKIQVRWMNFMDKDLRETEREAMAEEFFDIVRQETPVAANPFNLFTRVSSDAKGFLSKLTDSLSVTLKHFHNDFHLKMGEARKELAKNWQEFGHDPERIKNFMLQEPVDNYFEQCLVPNAPVFHMMSNGRTQAEATDTVLVQEELLLEIRVMMTKWLVHQGQRIHREVFSSALDPLQALCRSRPRTGQGQEARLREASRIISDRLCAAMTSWPGRGSESEEAELREDMEKRDWWDHKYANRLGEYLGQDSFPWLIVGFYLMRPDEASKKILLGAHFGISSSSREQPKAMFQARSEALMQKLESIPSKSWLNACTKALKKNQDSLGRGDEDRAAMHSALFDAIREGCTCYNELVKGTGIFDAGNDILKALLDISRMMTQRTVVHYPCDSTSMQFTPFGQQLSGGATGMTAMPDKLEEVQDALGECRKEKNLPRGHRLLAQCDEMVVCLEQIATGRNDEWELKCRDLKESHDRVRLQANLLSTPFQPSEAGGLLLVLPTTLPDNDLVRQVVDTLSRAAPGGEPDNEDTLSKSSPLRCPVHVAKSVDMSFIRRMGLRVVVYVRSPGVFSTEPEESEQRILAAIAAEPRVSVCFILWESPQARASDWDRYVDSWQRHASREVPPVGGERQPDSIRCVDVKLMSPTKKGFVEGVINELEVACQEARENADSRCEEIAKKIFDGVEEMHGKCDQLIQTMRANEDMQPKTFQKAYAREIKESFSQSLSRSSQWNKTKTTAFKIPSKQLLMREFLHTSGEVLEADRGRQARDMRTAQSMNELPCRSFLFRLLVGQTMDLARKTAKDSYDAVMKLIFDEVGKRFNISGDKFMREFTEFCIKAPPATARPGSQERKQWDMEMDVQKNIRDFLHEENFVSMYVGCVLAEVVPILYCTVSPRMLQDNADEGPQLTRDFYKQNLDTARSILIR